MSSGTVTERYARAILELGTETRELASITEQIRSFADTYQKSGDLRSVLDNPMLAADSRLAILKEVARRLGVQGLALNAIRVLMVRRRLAALPDVARRLSSLSDERAGIMRATVRTAQPMPESFYQRLELELEAGIHRKIALVRELDPNLVAGVVTQIGGITVDGSLRGRLAEIQRQLLFQ